MAQWHDSMASPAAAAAAAQGLALPDVSAFRPAPRPIPKAPTALPVVKRPGVPAGALLAAQGSAPLLFLADEASRYSLPASTGSGWGGASRKRPPAVQQRGLAAARQQQGSLYAEVVAAELDRFERDAPRALAAAAATAAHLAPGLTVPSPHVALVGRGSEHWEHLAPQSASPPALPALS